MKGTVIRPVRLVKVDVGRLHPFQAAFRGLQNLAMVECCMKVPSRREKPAVSRRGDLRGDSHRFRWLRFEPAANDLLSDAELFGRRRYRIHFRGLKKSAPASYTRCMIWQESDSSHCSPKLMVPKQISETDSPL